MISKLPSDRDRVEVHVFANGKIIASFTYGALSAHDIPRSEGLDKPARVAWVNVVLCTAICSISGLRVPRDRDELLKEINGLLVDKLMRRRQVDDVASNKGEDFPF